MDKWPALTGPFLVCPFWTNCKIPYKLEDGEACAEEHQVAFIETSAKTSYNVKRLFQRVAASLTNGMKQRNLNLEIIYDGSYPLTMF